MDKSNLNAPVAWIAALERSVSEIAAGQTVALEPVLDELQDSAYRLEERLISRKRVALKKPARQD